MKKLSALLLTLSMLLTLFSMSVAQPSAEEAETAVPSAGIIPIPEDATTVTGPETAYGTEYIVIRTWEQLTAFMSLADKESQNKNYILANDIDLTDATPLSGGAKLDWNLVLDGNGYSIKNPKFAEDADIEVLKLSGGNTVRNLSIGTKDAPIVATSETAGKTHGLMTAYLSTAGAINLENVHIYAKLTVKDSNVGGFFGKATNTNNVTFQNCTFNGSVTLNATKECNAGGFVGVYENGKVTVKSCDNNADITTLGTAGQTRSGGFIGFANISRVTVVNCANYGNLNAGADKMTGGFLGEYYLSNTGNTVTNYQINGFANYGTVSSAKMPVGGVFGYLNDATNAQSGGKIVLTNVRNEGVISTTDAPSENKYIYGIGGIIGMLNANGSNTDVELTQCVNSGIVSGISRTGGFIGRGDSFHKLTIRNCSNTAAIMGTGKDSGGFVGEFEWGNTHEVVVDTVLNSGDLSGGTGSKGGFCAYVGGVTLTLKNMLNLGNITTSGTAGALIVSGRGANNVTFENCVNLGEISGVSGSSGMVATATSKTTLKKCLSGAKVSESGGMIVGKTADGATYEGNYCLTPSNNANTTGVDETNKLTDLEAVRQFLNSSDNSYYAVWGAFLYEGTSNDDNIKLTLATPKLAGVQESAVLDGKLSVRLIASLQNTLRYESVGFRVKATVGEASGEQDLHCKTVYQSLIAMQNGTATAVKATSLGGKYVFALILTDVPASGTVTLEVTPYATDEKTVTNPVTYLGNGYALTYTDGVLTSIVPLA